MPFAVYFIKLSCYIALTGNGLWDYRAN